MATFITSKSVGENVEVRIQTNSGYWKSNHNGADSPVFVSGLGSNRRKNLQVTNSNGEFTIIPCDSAGNPSGNITGLFLSSNQSSNQITSFDGTGLTSLTTLYLNNNQLTSFDGTDLSSLTYLDLSNNQLISFDSTGLSGLTELSLEINQLTSFDGTGLSGLTYLYLNGNPMTPSSNNQILQQLNQNGLSGGEFITSNGRTSASNTDYDNLVSLGWTLDGLDLIAVGSGKLRVKGVNSGGVPTQPWDGGTIYNIGAVVTHEGQTWNCIQYAPSGYGPFGGYIDVYWTL